MKNLINTYLLVGIMLLVTGAGYAQTPWQSVTVADVTLEYRVMQDDVNLECKLTGETTGWMAVGFNPTSVMRNANIIITYVTTTETQIRDDWGTSNTSHASDVSMGGSSDVTLISGSEAAGMSMVHFSIPLDSEDQYDQALMIGETYPIILARGANNADNFTGMHADAGNATITLMAPVSLDDLNNVPPIGDRILSISPNPFRSDTLVKYDLKNGGEVRMELFNQRGQLIKTESFSQAGGIHEYQFGLSKQSAGIYYLKMTGPQGIQTRRITKLR